MQPDHINSETGYPDPDAEENISTLLRPDFLYPFLLPGFGCFRKFYSNRFFFPR